MALSESLLRLPWYSDTVILTGIPRGVMGTLVFKMKHRAPLVFKLV